MADSLRRILIVAANAALYFSGIVRLAYWLNRKRQIVVTYHNILPDAMLDDSLHCWSAHAASVFQRHLDIICRRLPATMELGRPGSCIVTFDDGYSNNLRVAAPLLEKVGAHAYFFVPLETARKGDPIWVDKFRMWLGAAPRGAYDIAGLRIMLDDVASRHRAAGALWRLIESDYRKRHAIIDDMNRNLPFSGLPLDPALRALRYGVMGIADLKSLAEAGHKIGSHSQCHDILSRLSLDELDADFRECAAYRGSLYNTDIYAYPFGGTEHLDERVLSACQRAGFSAAFVYLPSLDNTPFKPGPFTITRITLPNTANRFVIEVVLSGTDTLLRRVFRFVKRQSGGSIRSGPKRPEIPSKSDMSLHATPPTAQRRDRPYA